MKDCTDEGMKVAHWETDGPTVWMIQDYGLGVKLKEYNSCLAQVHREAHRLHSDASQASMCLNYFED